MSAGSLGWPVADCRPISVSCCHTPCFCYYVMLPWRRGTLFRLISSVMLSIVLWRRPLSKNPNISGCQCLQIFSVYLVLSHLDRSYPSESKRRNYVAQLYSGDEIDLFWKSVWETTQAREPELCMPGRKINKDHLSAFLYANEDYSQKIRSIHICKVKLPRSVREDTVLCDCKPSKDVCFTRESFSEWFLQSSVPEVRHCQPNVLWQWRGS